jgi:hypothetical protein
VTESEPTIVDPVTEGPQPSAPASITTSVAPRSSTVASATAAAEATARSWPDPGSVIEALATPPDEPFVVRPGSAAADPAVQAARAELEAARTAFRGDVEELRASGRRAVDVKAKLRRLPRRIQEDPRPFVIAAAAGTALVAGVTALRRRGRRAYPEGILPASVEETLKGLKDGDKIRRDLADSFGVYLAEHGIQSRGRRRGVPTVVTFLVLPLASTFGREAIRRFMRQPAGASPARPRPIARIPATPEAPREG